MRAAPLLSRGDAVRRACFGSTSVASTRVDCRIWPRKLVKFSESSSPIRPDSTCVPTGPVNGAVNAFASEESSVWL